LNVNFDSPSALDPSGAGYVLPPFHPPPFRYSDVQLNSMFSMLSVKWCSNRAVKIGEWLWCPKGFDIGMNSTDAEKFESP
jgi:hypothetical protein